MERTVTGSKFKRSVVQNWTGHLESVKDWQDLLRESYWGTADTKACWHHSLSCQQLKPILELEPILNGSGGFKSKVILSSDFGGHKHRTPPQQLHLLLPGVFWCRFKTKPDKVIDWKIDFLDQNQYKSNVVVA